MSAERLVVGNAVIEYGIYNLRFGLITEASVYSWHVQRCSAPGY